MKRSKWIALTMLVTSGALLLQAGCLTAFWQGFATNRGPTDSRWLNLAIDVANEVIFG